MAIVRVALSATNIGSIPIGGGETFVIGLANALAERDDVRCGVMISKAGAERVTNLLSPRVEQIEIAEKHGWRRVIADYTRIDASVQEYEPDVVHFPHEWCPRSSYPTILTIQNVWWMHPHGDRHSIRGRALRQLVRHTSKWSSTVVAVSSPARDLWCALTGLQKDAVPIIPEGLELPDGIEDRHRETARIAERGAFVLAIVSESPNKNYELTRRAFMQVRRVLPDLQLLVAGVRRPDEPGIHHLGWVDRREILGLMAAAKLVFFLSSVESFGLPALEALGMGTRCVVLEGTPMADEFRNMVIPVTADETSVAEATMVGIAEGPLGDSIRDQVRHRYSWQAAAKAWHRIYESAIERLSAE